MSKKETSNPNNPNTVIWDALCKTDPGAAKDFTRGGGFRGTAIKPIWQIEQMTKLFGPMGKGWGILQNPDFSTIHIEQTGETLVYCTVHVWYNSPNEASSGVDSNIVVGVGGDKIAKKTRNGIETDDEAFKKAYTDALCNAFKHLGMSADIHSGHFEGNKYVEEEPRDEPKSEPKKARKSDASPEVEDARAKFTSLKEAINKAASEEEAVALYHENVNALEKIGAVSPTGKEQLLALFHEKAPSLTAKKSTSGTEVSEKINEFIAKFTADLAVATGDDAVMRMANEHAKQLDWLQTNDKDRYAVIQAAIDKKINEILGG